MTEIEIKNVLDYYQQEQHRLQVFLTAVSSFFLQNQNLQPLIHSVKYRLKDMTHLEDKLKRKYENRVVTPDDLFEKVTDLAGVRVLHLYPAQFEIIHKNILEYIEIDGSWKFHEDPVAYTWDPEAVQFYEKMGLKTELRETYYTSIHYVVRPNNNMPNAPRCEIQVRTLFEEIWGEIDHNLNYPHPTNNLACKEQLRVLSKLVSTGTRLADSIYRCANQDIKI